MDTRTLERTGFQEYVPYQPALDLQTDFVMVYGIDDDMPGRVRGWREKGYVVHLMTGISWGTYQDYLNGGFDGRRHWDEGQVNFENKPVCHGADTPYMVPTVAFSDYLTARLKPAVDAGVEAVHLEEPEFWADSGYSDAFKREWELFYREPWQPPNSSADAQYRASRLKAYLYTRCLGRVCSALKEYAKVKYDRNLRCYVPTHSLLNYTQWRIVSPESKLLDLPCIDGYIAQVWTGTSRTKNIYNGKLRERTFETAFLEYGVMQELVRGTGRQMWFLHDPIEDNPRYTWREYRRDYFKILTASLLNPAVSKYEVCPWPNRVFKGAYPKGRPDAVPLPADYGSVLLTVMHTLEDMKQNDLHWEGSRARIGVLFADSAMYQRCYPQWSNGFPEQPDDPYGRGAVGSLSAFFGLAMPLLKYGLPVRPVQLDNVRRFAGYLDEYDTLLLSYEFMKPESPDLHATLAGWVSRGGSLVYVGDGSDAFHKVREWWNTGKIRYANPAEHLFETLGLPARPDEGVHRCGKGLVAVLSVQPVAIARSGALADKLRGIVKTVSEAGEPLIFSNSFVLHRGPYLIAAVLDESVSDEPLRIRGHFVDLLRAGQPVVDEKVVAPGGQALLVDLDKIGNGPKLIAAASRMEQFVQRPDGFTCVAKGPDKIDAFASFRTPRRPESVSAAAADGSPLSVEWTWNAGRSVLRLHYKSNPAGLFFRVALEGPAPGSRSGPGRR